MILHDEDEFCGRFGLFSLLWMFNVIRLVLYDMERMGLKETWIRALFVILLEIFVDE